MVDATPRSSSVSVIVPCLNEEANLQDTITTVRHCAGHYFKDWEIIIFNDGSTDRTGEIADRLAQEDSRISVVHHATPHNLGACYFEGVGKAGKDYVILVPGDNECGKDVIEPVFRATDRADIVIPYTANQTERTWIRRTISESFVKVVNFCSKTKLKYYNGCVLHRTEIVKQLNVNTDCFAYQAEILVSLLHQGRTYVEVGTHIQPRPKGHGKSKAFKLINVYKTFMFLAKLFVRCHFRLGNRRQTATQF